MDTPRLRNQTGASIIMLIGIVAALAVAAATLVVFSGNVQSNTADQRVRDKSAGVAEAAVDGMIYQMSLTWPKTASTQPVLDATTIRSQFPATEYPGPKTGAFVGAVYYDNSDTNSDGKVNSLDAHYDNNNDQLMYVEAQGTVGVRTVRIQALVKQKFAEIKFPKGVAVYVGGNLTSNGGGNNPKITIEDQGSSLKVYGDVGGTIENPSVFEGGATPIIPQVAPPLSSILPDSILAQIVAMAKGMGTYYDRTKSPPDAMPSDFSGLKVINVADGTSVALGNNGTINSAAKPGILLVLGGPNVTLDMGGNAEFWGVLYTDGTFQSAHGTPTIHGMVICKSNLDMKGTPNVMYNESAIVNLSHQWGLSVQVVQNTWREIAPVLP
jgi:hypothetical protein